MQSYQSIQINMRLPSKLVSEIDAVVDNGGYSSRQELVKEALREFLKGVAQA